MLSIIFSCGFTLSSNTADNSKAQLLFDQKPSEEPRNNTFAVQLKKFYRGISTLETRGFWWRWIRGREDYAQRIKISRSKRWKKLITIYVSYVISPMLFPSLYADHFILRRARHSSTTRFCRKWSHLLDAHLSHSKYCYATEMIHMELN